MPGLLQTADYVRALTQVSPAIPANELDNRIEARIRRQHIFNRRPPVQFRFFMDEYTLLRTGPGEEIMSQQAHYLLRMSVRSSVDIRIISDSVGFHAGRMPFHLMEFTESGPVVHIEDQTSVLFLERPDTVAGYRRVVAELKTVALNGDESRAWLTGLASALGAPREEHDEQPPALEEELPQ